MILQSFTAVQVLRLLLVKPVRKNKFEFLKTLNYLKICKSLEMANMGLPNVTLKIKFQTNAKTAVVLMDMSEELRIRTVNDHVDYI